MKIIEKKRQTKETAITLKFGAGYDEAQTIASGIPFFDHLLGAFALHGNFCLMLEAEGDLEVDFHHTVEDVGLALGDAISDFYQQLPSMARFGHAVVPMDDALAEVTLDLCNRPYCVYSAHFPQSSILDFDTALVKEFCIALSGRAKMTAHFSLRYADNSHHAVEALFKACGIALRRASLKPADGISHLSTKGTLRA